MIRLIDWLIYLCIYLFISWWGWWFCCSELSDLVVNVIQAKDLERNPVTGSQDSYVKLWVAPHHDDRKYQTKVIYPIVHTTQPLCPLVTCSNPITLSGHKSTQSSPNSLTHSANYVWMVLIRSFCSRQLIQWGSWPVIAGLTDWLAGWLAVWSAIEFICIVILFLITYMYRHHQFTHSH